MRETVKNIHRRITSRPRLYTDQKGIMLWHFILVLLLLVVLTFVGLEQIDRMKMKNTQQEAQDNLIRIAKQMDAYRLANGGFTTDLSLIKWQPKDSPKYLYGFTVPHYPNQVKKGKSYLSHTGFHELNQSDPRGQWDHSRAVRHNGLYLNQFDLVYENAGRKLIPQANDEHFLVGAVADLDDDPELDRWVVDSQWNLIHVFNDITNQHKKLPDLNDFVESLEDLREREARNTIRLGD